VDNLRTSWQWKKIDWKSKLTFREFFRRSKPAFEMVFGGVLALLLGFAAVHLKWFTTHITVTPVISTPAIIAILAACYALYLVRFFSPLAYGTFEVFIGCLAIVGTMVRDPEHVAQSLLIVQLAAGMYLVVRGFDNLAKVEPFLGGYAKFRELWDAIRRRKSRC
jgi:hypothetical protein